MSSARLDRAGMVAPSREVPLVFMVAWRVMGAGDSPSASSGEAKRCVSMSAEKRRRTPDGGLESLSVKEDSEQDRRFLKGTEWREEERRIKNIENP